MNAGGLPHGGTGGMWASLDSLAVRQAHAQALAHAHAQREQHTHGSDAFNLLTSMSEPGYHIGASPSLTSLVGRPPARLAFPAFLPFLPATYEETQPVHAPPARLPATGPYARPPACLALPAIVPALP
jgi:hypothetical protein